ncbi:hypothetical protein V6U90_09435 [Micromonospora sp. CPCC 206060]|uniref:hypothetical protein n=1 Tax=Micromonospora sp. CPCC 206060 TaxID=3122406 RepID=UPI002FF283AF
MGGTGAKQGGVVTPAALAPVAIMREDRDYRGSTLTYSAEFDCTLTTADVDYWVELITPEDWNDEIGSFIGGRACWVSLFEYRGWAGASSPFMDIDDELGVLDDESSSIRWS